MQVAELAYIPADQPLPPKSNKGLATTLYHPEDSQRPASKWLGDEGFYRSGTFGGPGQITNRPSELGGTVVRRRLRNYALDYRHVPEADACNKEKANIRGRAAGFAVCHPHATSSLVMHLLICRCTQTSSVFSCRRS